MISIQSGLSTKLGSCNACNRWIGPNGNIEVAIFEIDLKSESGGISFRLCFKCLRKLYKAIKSQQRCSA